MSADLHTIAESLIEVDTDTGTGSGVCISKDDTKTVFLTCAHVIEGAKRVSVVRRSYKRDAFSYPRTRAKVAALDSEADLAVITVEKPLDIPIMPLADEEPALYQTIYLGGHPNGLGWICVTGAFQGPQREAPEFNAFSGLSFDGSSGGIVANLNCALVGIMAATPRDDDVRLPVLGFCIPLSTIKAFLDRNGGKAAK